MKPKSQLFYSIFVAVICFGRCEAMAISPDSEMQAEIDRVVVQLGQASTQQDGLRALEKLEQAHSDKEALFQQVVLYMRFGAKSEERGYGAMGMLNKLNVDKATRIKAILPQLDASDAELRNIAVHLLRSTDKDKAHAEGVNFDAYEQVLRENPSNQPTALIGYMYDRDPQMAVKSIARVYATDVAQAEVAAKASIGAKESVDYFAARSEWWAHLYVLAMMEKEPYLRTPDLVKKLERNDNPLVREKVSKLKEKLQPR